MAEFTPPLPERDFVHEVLLGNIPGTTTVSIIGHDSTLTTTRITLSPGLGAATGEIDQSGLESAAATVDVASTDANDTSAGSGLRTLLLQGLDGSGNAQTETISLNGQTEVTSANTYGAILGMRGLTAGSGNTSAGNIWMGNGAFTSGVPATKYCSSEVAFNKGMAAYYVVPTGKTLYLRQFTLSLSQSNKAVDVTVESGTDGLFFVTENIFGAESGPSFQGGIIAVPGLAAGTHIRIRGEVETGTSDVSTILGCYLVDD